MDGFRTFVQGMTIWNWLALIAFIFFPLSALNAFFGLRSRYLDWQAPKSKAKFKKRVTELFRQVIRIGRYRKEPQFFYLLVLNNAAVILVSFLSSTTLWLCVWGLQLLTPSNKVFAVWVVSAIMMFVSFLLAIRLSRLIHKVRHPEELIMHVLSVISEGKKQSLLKENTIFINAIFHSDLFASEMNNTIRYQIDNIREGFPKTSVDNSPSP